MSVHYECGDLTEYSSVEIDLSATYIPLKCPVSIYCLECSDAFMIHFEETQPKSEMGGYFGVQAHAKDNDMLLFSLWDKNPGHDDLWQAAIPWTDSSNCHRHCNDCTNTTNHSNTAPDGTTGTQCPVHIPLMESGSTFRLRIKRIAQNAKAFTYNRTWIGDAYQVSVRHLQSGKSWIIGSILVDGSFSGINKMSTFCEHIGCTPCKAFEFRSQRRGPWVLDPPGTELMKAYSEGEGDDSTWLCKAQEALSQSVGELELHTGTPQDFNRSSWDVNPLYVCNVTEAGCAYPGVV